VIDEAEIYLNLAGLIDIGAEKLRLSKEIEATQHYAKSLELKLADKAFVSHAPEAVVAGEKNKFDQAKEKLDKLKNQLSSL
jgi:valyl-tRNA synthetase